MICSTCGKDNEEGKWVCSECGEPLAASAHPSQYSPYAESQLPESSPTPAEKDQSSKITVVIALALISVLAAMSLWFFFIRGSKNLSTPAETMETYIQAVGNGDCDTLYELTTAEVRPDDRRESIQACSMALDFLQIDFSDYKTLSETVDGNTASVTFQVTTKAADLSYPDEETMQLVKEDGEWKVRPDETVDLIR